MCAPAQAQAQAQAQTQTRMRALASVFASPRGLLRRTALLTLLPVVFMLLAAGGTAAASTAAPTGRVVIVGVPGLLWSDLDPARTPNLWTLVQGGGSASLSTRAAPPKGRGFICPVEGWLTLSAGQRAGAPGMGCALPAAPQVSGAGASAPDWAALVSYNVTETDYKPVLGQLGQLVVSAGGRSPPWGRGPFWAQPTGQEKSVNTRRPWSSSAT
nr:hypothetical protein GCM10020093_077150 [Planobispora longispora]